MPSDALPAARLLIVDDEAAHMRALCETLSGEGYVTTGYSSATEALVALRPGAFDVVLTDLRMPDMDGVALLESIRAVDPDIVGIVMTGHGAIDTAVQAMQAGALDYVLKPFKLTTVLPVIIRALAIRRLRAANTELQQRVRERTEELETANRELATANKDLESFSYSVSHDLQAPLRHINGFVEIFLTSHAAAIDEKGRKVLDHVVESAARMGQLIDDLLRLSRFSRQPLEMSTVAVADIVARVVSGNRALEPDREVDVEIDTLPNCNGDPSLMEQVFANLVSNAFKFTRKRHPAKVTIGCKQDARELVYFVRDNGAGFDPGYAHKLFGVFQRLHSTKDFDGTGIGLSIVHRIVQRHGGRVWAEGEVGKGATFFVSVPHSLE
jgi:two-component system sensor histidine kinase/response regulator